MPERGPKREVPIDRETARRLREMIEGAAAASRERGQAPETAERYTLQEFSGAVFRELEEQLKLNPLTQSERERIERISRDVLRRYEDEHLRDPLDPQHGGDFIQCMNETVYAFLAQPPIDIEHFDEAFKIAGDVETFARYVNGRRGWGRGRPDSVAFYLPYVTEANEFNEPEPKGSDGQAQPNDRPKRP